jgi:hypothetical protein
MKNLQSTERKKPKAAAGSKSFLPLNSLFDAYTLEDKGGFITQEFQDFGYRLAVELDDMPHKSLYMRLAKKEERGMLERALSFVSDAENAKSKGKLFMWKLQQLKKEKNSKK